MEIEIPANTDNSSIGDFDSQEAGIDKSSLPFVLEMLSKNFYSNPIGSTVREITSNCFDSHTEAKVDEPVIIEISGNDERFVSFKDFGVGLSPDRIKNIYLKYFSSTKRSNNEQIGGFGLGSKSPLSYTDYFYINTISEGMRYEYIFSKGNPLPTLDLLLTEETDQRNGTEIKIPILKKEDEKTFVQEMKDQLSYFDNVYFIGCGINNEYRVYEGKYFKYRNKDQYSDEMHICFGKVAYPIDWKQLRRDYLEIPVAVKFDIGELVVTPNREALRYTEKVISLVNERIDKTLQELKDLYESQAESHDDFKKWWTTKRDTKSIILGEDRLKSPEFKKFKRNSIFTPFEGLGIEDFKTDDPLRYMYNFNKRLNGYHKVIDEIFDYSRNFTDFFLDYTTLLSYCKDSNFSGVKNFNNKNARLVFRRSTKETVENILPYKKWSYGFGHRPRYEDMAMTINPPQKNYFHFIANRKDTKNKDVDDDHYFNLGLSIRLYKFIKFFRTLLESQVKDYHRPISNDVAEQYKIIKLENDGTLRRKLEQKVFVKLINNDSEFDWSIADIEQFTGLVIYGSMEDRDRLERAHTFLGMRNSLVTERINGSSYNREKIRELNPKACKLIRIAKNNFKYFKNKPNMIHVKDLYSDNRLFRQVASSYKIENVLKELLKHYSNIDTKRFIDFYSKINEDVGSRLNNLYRYYKKFHNNEKLKWSTVVTSDLKNEVLGIATKLNLFDPIVEEDILVIDKYFEGVELLKHIDLSSETLPVILKYLREKKKKINFDYYTKFVPPSQPGDQLSIDFEPIQETKFKIITEAA